MDIDLCLLKWLIGMIETSVYVSVLMKKRIYWPTGINGNRINERCEKKAIMTSSQEIGR